MSAELFNMPKAPEVKFTRNGYELRTDILKMAKDLVAEEYHSKFHGWELSVSKDDKGNITTRVGMPEFPGLDQVLQTAEKMYAFVNAATPKTR